MHVPAHAVSQQYPSTQFPFAHCRASAHALPLACAALHVRAVVSHQYPLTQSPSVTHAAPHAFPEQTYGAHGDDAPEMHDPDPLHACPVCVPLAHVVEPHAVPAGHCAQAPAPLHVPLVPQLVAACATQSPSGLVPVATARHLPSAAPLTPPCLLLLHAMHVPAHAVSQQYPSTQFAFPTHCVLDVHADPCAWSAWHV